MQEIIRKKVEAKIKDQLERISQLELELVRQKSYLDGLRDMLKLVPVQSSGSGGSPAVLREGSDLAKTRDILAKAGAPLHINEILKRMGKEVTRNTKAALAGSLGTYVRKGEVFTRPAANCFGLVDFAAKPAVATEEDIPDDFGLAEPVTLGTPVKT